MTDPLPYSGLPIQLEDQKEMTVDEEETHLLTPAGGTRKGSTTAGLYKNTGILSSIGLPCSFLQSY